MNSSDLANKKGEVSKQTYARKLMATKSIKIESMTLKCLLCLFSSYHIRFHQIPTD